MIKNLGLTDRIIRISVAVILAVLFLTNIVSGILGFILLVAAGILLFTAFFSFCPIYVLFGFNTCCNTEDEVSK